MNLRPLKTLTKILIISLSTASCSHRNDKPTEAPPVKVAAIVVDDTSARGGGAVYSGTVASANTATVSFAVAGTIERLYAEEGQAVSQGQLLGQLRQGDYENADNIARAQLAEAEDAYARLEKLHDANALPDIKWVEMQQKLRQAQNAAEISGRALSETSLRSPISGVVSRKMADNGQNVAPIEPVYEIVSTGELTMDVSLPENEIAGIAAGQGAVITFAGADIAPIAGRVTQKSVVADPLTRSYKVKVSIPSPSRRILPGMVGSVTFDATAGTEESGEIIVPSQAVTLNDDNRTFVWIIRDGKPQRRFVEAGRMTADGVAVTAGLTPGDTVVVEGMQKIGTGSKVDITIK